MTAELLLHASINVYFGLVMYTLLIWQVMANPQPVVL